MDKLSWAWSHCTIYCARRSRRPGAAKSDPKAALDFITFSASPSALGPKDILTPQRDRLFREGITFQSFLPIVVLVHRCGRRCCASDCGSEFACISVLGNVLEAESKNHASRAVAVRNETQAHFRGGQGERFDQPGTMGGRAW